MINIVDLFSGGGGLTEGFREHHFNIISHVEMNKNACKTLQLRDAYYYLKQSDQLSLYSQYIKKTMLPQDFWKKIPKTITNRTINETISENSINSIFKKIDSLAQSKKINGIIGGPPCQAYSTIGRARNSEKKEFDKRIYLYHYYTKFLQHFQPDFFVFENVKGLLSFKDVHNDLLLNKILTEFSNSLGINSYHVSIKLIDASTLGVPQKRERLIIFGYKSTLGAINFFDELLKQKEKPVVIKELFQDLPFMHSNETINHYSKTVPCAFVARWLRNTNVPLTQNTSRPNNNNDLAIYRIVAINKQNHKNTKYPELPEYLITHKKRNIFLDRFKSLDYNKVSHTVVAHIAKDGHYYIHPDVSQNRSISVREAARVQTFPDDFYFENSRTAAFTQIGNAVPPYLSHKISTAILHSVYSIQISK